MRIIGGRFKGRRFSPPANKWPTRPTTDFAREALFNILYHRIDLDEVSVLDLFGGMGGHTFEFVSRGAADICYVDSHGGCARFVKKTLEELGAKEKVTVVRGDVFRYLKGCARQFDYIFADPPYQLPTLDVLPDLIFERKLLTPDGLFVLEHGTHHCFDQHPYYSEERDYGNTIFSFFEYPPSHSPEGEEPNPEE
jgi:16S rRNA (guanine(966)-N(2))-methyltransferase RsmD